MDNTITALLKKLVKHQKMEKIHQVLEKNRFGEEPEAAVHVAAEEVDAPAFLEGIVHEVGKISKECGCSTTRSMEIF